ncbi:NUDIX domain-containing protein [Ktedonobacter robiniae]|uniref:NUDIX hydrolase n=1 Tax=Ktedonobacter robiniae TaxID=2778365 RepID=UPI0019158506
MERKSSIPKDVAPCTSLRAVSVMRIAGFACAPIRARSRRERFLRWAMPDGGLDVGETPAQGAVREALEETGLRACCPGRST